MFSALLQHTAASGMSNTEILSFLGSLRPRDPGLIPLYPQRTGVLWPDTHPGSVESVWQSPTSACSEAQSSGGMRVISPTSLFPARGAPQFLICVAFLNVAFMDKGLPHLTLNLALKLHSQ